MRRSFEMGREKSLEKLDEVDEVGFDITKNDSNSDPSSTDELVHVESFDELFQPDDGPSIYDELWDSEELGKYTIDVPTTDKHSAAEQELLNSEADLELMDGKSKLDDELVDTESHENYDEL